MITKENDQIAFTLCSNNYLAHAKTIRDSFLKYHPDFKFVIGLVDRPNIGFDYAFFDGLEILSVEAIEMKEFEELKKKYNITELNTAVKPAFFNHLFKKYSAEKIIYIDPDILVTSRFVEVLNILDRKNIIITPHTCSPIEDEFAPTDYHTLRGGVFNLGFIALSNYPEVKNFLDWWHARVVKYGFANFSLNMFYDQIWINYVPVFYDNYFILKNPGYNMANWNLHERVLSQNEEENFMVNENFPLRFFHFSSYSFRNPQIICSYLTRYNFSNRPDLKMIFKLYRELLIKNNVEEFSRSELFFYPEMNKTIIEESVLQPVFYKKVYKTLKNAAKRLIQRV